MCPLSATSTASSTPSDRVRQQGTPERRRVSETARAADPASQPEKRQGATLTVQDDGLVQIQAEVRMSTSLPASSFSAGAGMRNGRELTAHEQADFRRRRVQTWVGAALLGVVIVGGMAGISWLAQHESKDLRTWSHGNGQIHIVAEYTKHQKNVHYLEYYQNGNKKAEGSYVKDVENGAWVRYYWGGGLESKGEMKMGLREGPWEMFHANGKKKAVESYKNGVADGHWVSWYENGQIEADANYKNGLAVGTERHWYENGQSSSEGEYVLGYAEGRHLSWHENGKIAVDGSYKRGRRDGEFKEFAEDGSLWRTQTWVQGDFVSEAAPN